MKVYHDDGSATNLVETLYGTDEQSTASMEISGLPKVDLTGKTYLYCAKELDPAYVLSGGQVSEDDIVEDGDRYGEAYVAAYEGNCVTNMLQQTKVFVEKKWNQASQPTSLTMEVEYKGADGTWKKFSPRAQVKLDGTADTQTVYYEYEPWRAVWNNLPEVMPGSDISQGGKTQYRVIESLSGYVVEDSQVGTQQQEGEEYVKYTYTNVEATSLKVEKRWYGVPGGEQQAVVVGLYRTQGAAPDSENAQPVLNTAGRQMTLTLNSNNQWKGTFPSLPKYSEEGSEYYYFARELTIGGKPAKEAELFINHTDEKTDAGYVTLIKNIDKVTITGTKTWKDHHNAYETRPDSIELTLWRWTTDEQHREKVAAQPQWQKDGAKDQWTYFYRDLPSHDADGSRYTYQVEEKPVDGYELSQDGYHFVNTLSEKIQLTVRKNWHDGDNEDGLRPESVTFVLYADGKEVERVQLKKDASFLQVIWQGIFGGEDNTWEYTFTDLDKYDENGKLIAYTVEEEWQTEDYVVAEDGFTITNTVLTQIDVEKSWGGVPDKEQQEVLVGLYRKADPNAEPEKVLGEDGAQLTIALNQGNGWRGTFENLRKFDDSGNRYIYSVEELEVGGILAEQSGYLIHTSQQEDGAIRIINIAPIDITGTKTWKDHHNAYGTRPDSIELILWRSVAGQPEQRVEVQPTWIKQGDVWEYEYTGLPKTDDRGMEYTYKVEEIVPNGYSASQQGYQLTNLLAERIHIPIKKIWQDSSNQGGLRPESITVVLYANGKAIDEAELKKDAVGLEWVWQAITGTEDNVWEYTFEDLPKYDENGKEIAYTVAEKEVPDGYEVNYDGFTITNSIDGDLIVSKEVTGLGGEPNREFHFTIQLNNSAINGMYGDVEFVDGVASFTLKDGESAYVEGLPADVEYIVSEREANTEGYITTIENKQGTVIAGEEIAVDVANAREHIPGEPPVKTGDPYSMTPWLIAGAAALAAVVIILTVKAKNGKRQHKHENK